MNQPSNEIVAAVMALEATVSDGSKTLEERRTALRHICQLLGEPEALVSQVPAEDLEFVGGAMTGWLPLGFGHSPLRDSMESVAEGRARRQASGMRRV